MTACGYGLILFCLLYLVFTDALLINASLPSNTGQNKVIWPISRSNLFLEIWLTGIGLPCSFAFHFLDQAKGYVKSQPQDEVLKADGWDWGGAEYSLRFHIIQSDRSLSWHDVSDILRGILDLESKEPRCLPFRFHALDQSSRLQVGEGFFGSNGISGQTAEADTARNSTAVLSFPAITPVEST